MDIESGIIYNLFLFIACVMAFFTEGFRYNPFGLLLTYLFIVVFWSIRYKIGFDYEGYMDIFGDIKSGGRSYVEPGFWLLNKYFAYSPLGYIGVLTFMTALSYFFLFKLLIREQMLTFGIFFSMVFLLQFMLANQVRQGLVVVYLFSIFHFLEERKYFKYILCLLPALLFHYSAIFLIGLVPLVKIRLNKITWIVLLVSSYVLYLLGFFRSLGTFLLNHLPMYQHYQQTDWMFAEEIGFSIVMLFTLFIALYLLIFNEDIKRPEMMVVFLTGVLLNNVFVEFHLLGRLLQYLTFFNVVLAAVLCKNNIRNGLPVMISCWLLFIFLAGKEPAKNGNLPYQTVFEKPLELY